MRMDPLSYLCTAGNVTPRYSATAAWVSRCRLRHSRTRWPTNTSMGSGSSCLKASRGLRTATSCFHCPQLLYSIPAYPFALRQEPVHQVIGTGSVFALLIVGPNCRCGEAPKLFQV